ncbi:Transmembrane serine protease 8, partial [Fasciolopsis buskii]
DTIPVHCGRNAFDELWLKSFGQVQTPALAHDLTKRIVGGTVSKFGEWPWLTSFIFYQNAIQVRRQRERERLAWQLRHGLSGDTEFGGTYFEPPTLVMPLSDGGRKFHMCGGTLIHPLWVLSAAHCFVTAHKDYPDLAPIPERWTVRVGEHDMLDETVPHYDMEVEKIIVNAGYNPNTQSGDIALVKLARPVPRARHVNIACLPAQDELVEPGRLCFSAGWGHQEESAKTISTVLRHVALSIVSNEQCRASYDKLNETMPFAIIDSMLCAGDVRGGKDSCQFDSGGPLMCKHGSQWRIEGVVSFGFSCGTQIPGVYTRVSSYVKWIRDVTNIF